MARYLVVAHKTATSPLLLERVEEIARDDRDAEFTLLVPATHVSHRLVCDEAETREVAQQRAAEAATAFAARGLRVVRAEVGDDSPLLAIEDELRASSEPYDAIILSTLRPGVSSWLRLDIPRRVSSRHSLPVFHIVEGDEAAWASTAERRREVARGQRPVVAAETTAGPSRLDQPSWFFTAVVGLLGFQLGIMVLLAVQIDTRFFIAEALMLTFFLIMLPMAWPAGSPLRRRR